ncbi:MAG: flagellar export protein FliJ [Planctomycetales bacterium]|nr:flagellar export protein FliJ [Planctomycetales bacterium]
MKKFRFRLNTLRKLREAHRDEMRAKLDEAYQALRILEDQISAAGEEVAQLQAAQRGALDGDMADVNAMLEAGRYQAVLRSQQKTMQDQIQLLTPEIERRRQAVIVADKEVRILDKLEERQRAEHRHLRQRAEISELDEIGSQSVEAENQWAL